MILLPAVDILEGKAVRLSWKRTHNYRVADSAA